ncbi:MAG: hypothetical protein M1834_006891 [Cirrosporium novae-zelandiae]|nr:MAG: hypothetical protein M1834_006891 [Cirrosporium novae-zelandiae]
MGSLSPISTETAYDVRQQCRFGSLQSPTAGWAPGYIQANLLVLPSKAAKDFSDLCARNPVPCPLLAYTPIGNSKVVIASSNNAGLGGKKKIFTQDFDIRTDIPKYNVYRDGRLVDTKTDILSEWTEDHVAFLIGCSFSFEDALSKAGLTPRHWEDSCNVTMFNTTRRLNPAGIFTEGTYVVSMRPYLPEQIEEVRNITRSFMGMHGEPIAWGWKACEELGIKDVQAPDFGQPVKFKEGEVPVFWGCGVTPQQVVMDAKSKIKGNVMAHAPGHMMVLDLKESDLFCGTEMALE